MNAIKYKVHILIICMVVQVFLKKGHSSIFQLQLGGAEACKAELSNTPVIFEFQVEVNDCLLFDLRFQLQCFSLMDL